MRTVHTKANILDTRLVLRLSFMLVILAITAVAVRWVNLEGKGLEGTVWKLSIDIGVIAKPKQTVVSISPPYHSPRHSVLSQNLSHAGFRIIHSGKRKDSPRAITAVAEREGYLQFVADYLVQIKDKALETVKPPQLSEEKQLVYLSDNDHLDLKHPVMQALADKLAVHAGDKARLIDAIYKETRRIAAGPTDGNRTVPAVIGSGHASVVERAYLMVALCRAHAIPARLVAGFVLAEKPYAEPHYWLEVYENGWKPYDPAIGYKQSLPLSYLAMRYDAHDIISTKRAEKQRLEYSIEEEFSTDYLPAAKMPALVDIFNLERMSIEVRSVLATLFLLPIGVLITAVFRHFVGIHSYGVFTPTLLALAVSHNDGLTSLVILGVIIIFSYVGYVLFPRKLPRTPRLAIIFILVALSIAGAVSMIDFFAPNPEGYAILLPIIILTTLIDRFYSTVDSSGLNIALTRLLWTAIVAALCFPVLHFEALGAMFVRFPELHFVTLAGFLLLSIYHGQTLAKYLPSILVEKTSAAPERSKKMS